MYKEVDGDLIKLALEGSFDVIAHGCNCLCNMGAGIAPQMAKAFGCNIGVPQFYPLEAKDKAARNIGKTIGDARSYF